MKEYAVLQKIRYQFQLDLILPEHASELNYPCPKFILQPLIENSLTHGFRNNMTISLEIRLNDYIEIVVRDDGTGMDEDTLSRLRKLEPASNQISPENAQFGIGLHYVVQSLNDFYHGDYEFSIDSTAGSGTVIYMKVPKVKGGGYYA